MRKKLPTLLNKPPSEIDGYSVNTDFRVWLQVDSLMQKFATNTDEQNNETIKELCDLVFITAKIPTLNKMKGIIKFYKGYPNYLQNIKQTKKAPMSMSFEHDINWIIIAIRNQSGIDLSYHHKTEFHWWEFLLEVQSLEDNHYISQLMQIRGYTGKDKELIKLRNKYKIPKKQSEIDLLEKVEENMRKIQNGK